MIRRWQWAEWTACDFSQNFTAKAQRHIRLIISSQTALSSSGEHAESHFLVSFCINVASNSALSTVSQWIGNQSKRTAHPSKSARFIFARKAPVLAHSTIVHQQLNELDIGWYALDSSHSYAWNPRRCSPVFTSMYSLIIASGLFSATLSMSIPPWPLPIKTGPCKSTVAASVT